MDRFFNKVQKTETCWNWLGSVSDSGYGLFRYMGKTQKAHRVSYILFHGSIDPQLVIDHLCKNKACVNPKHLDLVLQVENVRRGLAGKINNPQSSKLVCPMGHEYSGINKSRHRICHKCKVIRQLAYVQRKRAIAK